MASEKPPVFDVVVVGAGPVGLALAAAVRREAGVEVKIALVEASARGKEKLRAVALSPGSRALLERLGAWRACEPQAQPIFAMTIYDGAPDDAVRIEQLRFANDDGAPLAHMAFADDLTESLEASAADAGVTIIEGAVETFTPGPFVAALTLADGTPLKARLVVGADGARSRLRGLAEIATSGWSTGQYGIVATLSHELDHEGRAEQHFLPSGPFAMLPLKGRQSSIVWNEPADAAERLIEASEPEFLATLERRFPPRLGVMRLAGGPRAFPLEFRFARSFVGDRLALIGDAAHLVHPLAGQGLNLGFRDVAALAEVLVERLRLGLDPGDRAPLEDYQRRRRFDALTSGLGMDAMNRLFSNNFATLRFARDLGLRAVDRMPPLKRRLVAEAAGAGQGAPRLLRGLGL